MKQEELSEIVKAIKSHDSTQSRVGNKEFMDSLSKIGIALCTAGILWVATQIQALDRKMIAVETNQIHQKTQLDAVTQFTQEPRFTVKDNDAANQKLKNDIRQEINLVISEVNGLRQKVEMNSKELERRSGYMEKNDQRLEKMIEDLRALKDRDIYNRRKIEDIEKSLSK